MSTADVSVLIVCLGNICRSPMGEAVLAHIAKTRGHNIVVDSCGTGAYHQGDDPDDRTVATCQKHKIPINHTARMVRTSDFTKFTHILAADNSNLRDLQRMAPDNTTAQIKLWGAYDDGKPIEDPYYGGSSGFERVYQQCVKLSNAYLDDVFGSQQ